MIYLVAVESGPRAGTCKIGFSTAPGRRSVGLAGHVKGAVTLLSVAPGTRDDERRLHDSLDAVRVVFGTEHEFFRRDEAVAAFNSVRGVVPLNVTVAVGDGEPRDGLFALDENDERARNIARGKIIHALRIAAGLSFREAAAAVGVSVGAWQRWEAGAEPNVISALRICALLGTTIEAVWGSDTEAAS